MADVPPSRATRLSITTAIATCLWVALVLTRIYGHGKTLGLDREVTDRLRHHAIPIAISVLYHSHPHDYTGFRDLAVRFQSGEPLEASINGARLQTPATAPGSDFWEGDDRGMADYVIGAFALFGANTRSFYSFYFVVLSISCALFLLGYWRQPMMIGILLFALAGIYACMSTIAEPLNTTGPALYEPRVQDVLALVATLHIAFAAWSQETGRRWILALAGQIAIFLFCYHSRSSLGWEAAFAVMVNVAWLLRSTRPAALALGLFAAGFVLLSAYQHIVYNPRYFKELGTRIVWHNALMGFGANPALAAKYGFAVSDAVSFQVVIDYMKQVNDPRLPKEWTVAYLGGGLGGWNTLNWFDYDSAARSLYFHVWRTDPKDALHCYAIDKPIEIYRLVMGTIRSEHFVERSFRPFGVVPLLIIAPGLFFAAAYGAHLGRAAAAAFLMFLCGLVPGFMFYSVPLTTMGAFGSLAFAAYVLAAYATQRATAKAIALHGIKKTALHGITKTSI